MDLNGADGVSDRHLVVGDSLPSRRNAVTLGGNLPISAADLVTSCADGLGVVPFIEPAAFQRLSAYVAALSLPEVGSAARRSATFELRRSLRARLALDELLTRRPTIRSERVNAPIFVSGLPRSGTTHVHRLLASKPGARSLRYWEAMYPNFESAYGITDDSQSRRRAGMELAAFYRLGSLARLKRDVTVDSAEEDSHVFAWNFEFPPVALALGWTLGEARCLGRESYAHFKAALQALSFCRGGGSWVVKSHLHMVSCEALFEEFPDARLVVLQRDPIECILSASTLYAIVGARYRTSANLTELVNEVAGAFGRICRAADACVPAFRDGRCVIIKFSDVIDRGGKLIARLVDEGLIDSIDLAAVEQYQSMNPRGRHGEIRSDFADFGTTASKVRTIFERARGG